MAEPLPPVDQEFLANTAPYVAAVRIAELATDALARSAAAAELAIKSMQDALNSMAGSAVKDAMVTAAATAAASAGLKGQALAAAEAGAAGAALAAQMARQTVAEENTGLASAFLASRLREQAQAEEQATVVADALAAAERNVAAAATEQAAAMAADSAAVKAMTGELARMDAMRRQDLSLGAQAVQSMAAYAEQARVLVARQEAEAQAARDAALALAEVTAAGMAAATEQIRVAAATAEAETRVGSFAQTALRAAAVTNAAAISQAHAYDSITAATIRAGLAAVNFVSGATRIGTIIHWVIAGGAELLAVVVPAMVALGAAALVAAQGAQRLYQHMTALYTATEATANMLHTTIGQSLGLTNVWQRMQNAADPRVYAAFASAIGIVREQFGKLAYTGLEVTKIFDTFAAKLQYDFSKAGGLGDTVNGLLARMIPDLVMLAQIFGNIGHALLNFASKMPGLAQGLLAVADAISKVILWISSLPGWLITSVMAIEEAWRWGGLLATVVSKLAIGLEAMGTLGIPILGAIAVRFATVFQSIALGAAGALVNLGGIGKSFAAVADKAAIAAQGVPVLGTALGKVGGAAETAGTKVETLGKNLAGAAGNLAMVGWTAAIIGGLVALGVVLDHTRSAAQQMADGMNRALTSVSNMQVIGVISSNLVTLDAQINKLSGSFGGLTRQMQPQVAYWQHWPSWLVGVGRGFTAADASASTFIGHVYSGLGRLLGPMGGVFTAAGKIWTSFNGAQKAAVDVAALTTAQQQQVQALKNVATGAAYLAGKYKTDLVGALALADAAGVKLAAGITGTGKSAAIAQLQVQAYVNSLTMMGQGTGQLGTDMTALAIQSQLAATKISQLNSALDAYLALVTGGTSSLAGLVTSIRGIGQVSQASAGAVGAAGGSISLSAGKIATALKGMGTTGAQVWQNFDTALNGAQTGLMDWIRTAGAAGAATKGQLYQATLDVASGFVKMAAKSVDARTQLLAFVKVNTGVSMTWAQLSADIKKAHGSLSGAMGIVTAITTKLGDMAQVAKNLGAVVSAQLDTATAKLIVKFSGLNAALQQYATDLANSHTPAAQLAQDQRNIEAAQARAARMQDQYTQTLNKGAQAADHMGRSSDTAGTKVGQMSTTTLRAVTNMSRLGSTGGAAAGNLATGMNSGEPKVAGAAQAWVHGVTSRTGTLPGALHAHGVQAGDGLAAGVRSAAGAVFSAGAAIMQGVLAGLRSAWGAVTSFISGVAGWIAAHKGPIEADRQLLVPHGQAIMDGLLAGMKSREPAIAAQAQRVAAIIAAYSATSMRIAAPTGMIPGGPLAAPPPQPVVNPGGSMLVPFTVPRFTAGAGGGQTVINLHQEVHGNVLTQQELIEDIRTGVLQVAHANSSSGLVIPGRRS